MGRATLLVSPYLLENIFRLPDGYKIVEARSTTHYGYVEIEFVVEAEELKDGSTLNPTFKSVAHYTLESLNTKEPYDG